MLSAARRAGAAGLSAALVLTGLSALVPSVAGAAVLGAVTVTPTSGTDSTLFGGSVNASCPEGTTDSYFSVDGPDLPADQAILAPGNTTGTGSQSFSGASIANIKSANSGSFASSGTYKVRFSCFGATTVTDSYEASLVYTAGGAGAYTISVSTAPGAPTGVNAASGNSSATVSWTAPADNGGSAITKYTVTATPAVGPAVVQEVLSGTTTTVTGLVNGTEYSVTVTATNAVGTGAASSPAATVTPAPSAPAAPTGVTATAGNGKATVAFAAPSDNGGSEITGYTVTASTGQTATGTASPIVVSVPNGTPRTFTVKASNAIGTGASSAASNAVAFYTTSLALTLSKSVVAYTQSLTASGKLTGGSVAGKPVTLKFYVPGKPTTAKVVTTTSTGNFSYVMKPTYNTNVIAYYTATASQTAATSPTRKVQVQPLVRFTSPANGTTTRARTITVKGKTMPAKPGAIVELYARSGSSSTFLIRAKVAADGTFSFTRTYSAGTKVLYVRLAATTTNAAAISPNLTLKLV